MARLTPALCLMALVIIGVGMMLPGSEGADHVHHADVRQTSHQDGVADIARQSCFLAAPRKISHSGCRPFFL